MGLLSLVPLAASVFGQFDAQRRAGNAARERERLLREYEGLIQQDYSDAVGSGRRNVLGQTGLLGDALTRLGGNLGAANAAGGVYNSSALAGSLAQAAQTGQATLADAAMRGQAQAQGILSQGRRFLTGTRLGMADNAYNDSRERLDAGYGGLANLIGSLSQEAFARTRGKAPGGGRSSVLDPGVKPMGMPFVPGMGSSGYGSGNMVFRPSRRLSWP